MRHRLPAFLLFLLAVVVCAGPAAAAPGSDAPLTTDGSCSRDAVPAKLRVERTSDAGRETTNPGISIDQPVITVTAPLAEGDSFVCFVTIRNRTKAKATYDITLAGLLGSRTEQTRVVPIDSPDIGATAATWIDPVEDTITLAAEEKARIPFVITVPPNAPTGGVFASIQFIARPPKAADGSAPQVAVTSGAAASLLLQVGGTGRAKLAFTDTRTHKLRTSRAAWTWRARLDNDGTLQARPVGRVRVRSMFGRTVARFDIRTRPLLPKGGAPVQVRWKGTPWFGIYRWDARVASTGDPTATPARATGWIVALPPWWLVALILLVAAAVVAWPIIRRQRAWRSYVDDEDLVDHDDLDPR